MYAIFESGGKQHRAEPGQRVVLEKLEAGDGDTVSFERVLMVRDAEAGECRIGRPYLAGTTVSATVLAHYRDPKVLVFKRKRRKGYRKKQGHRQARVQVRVDAIHEAAPDARAAKKTARRTRPAAARKKSRRKTG